MIPLLVLAIVLPLSGALECITCGVFLGAPTPDCRGRATSVNCSEETTGGCIAEVAENQVRQSMKADIVLPDSGWDILCAEEMCVERGDEDWRWCEMHCDHREWVNIVFFAKLLQLVLQ